MTLTAGARLGPYEILSPLGAGGMGEVYRARDPRLGREVAIKVLPEDVAATPERLRRFEHEARAVAALNHPNILTVFDVGTHDGTPYVVTELLEGETFRELLTRRAPTQQQVLAFAVQAAQGLAAAHRKGIVHRDLKPDNLFLTTDGRVKILDFGLATVAVAVRADSAATTQEDLTRPGMLMGTVAYMSPEQAKAQPVDPRSDVFSFGIVLYELLSRTHPFRRETMTATLTAILQETPPAPSTLDPEIPPALDWVVMRCLEKTPDARFASAHELGLALDAVLKAPAGASWLTEVEERNPYPGLQSFTEKDARAFFGREDEVKALWQRIEHRGLLAVIGPSGAGKTSFVRAGVVASRPEGWGAIVCKPGASPLRSLGQALAPELASDPEALRRLLSFDEPSTAFDLIARWRRAKGDALLVVDQFEELFTLNAKATQELFASLLGRLATEAGVHVLLSLRDDFLIRCSEHEPLAPVFESLTPLPALTTEGLRRALVEPAKTLGYAFEDEALVTEMIASVEGVRGALPLLAFAVSRLWEKRDRDKKLLTREAYEQLGGVAGALAQHAEAVMSRVGPERQSIVREIFRNLVTAQGTRAIVDRDELLSAFPERNDAYAVLRALIDARLLTSYEVEETEGQPSRHRVEVAHESLITAWPRLVKWQAQDEEGAVLRDQIKQAAHLWEEKSRTADLLWTGTAYQEFELWRERYPGKLTAVETDFARAMADRARRRKRLVRSSVAAAFLALTGVAVAIGVSRFQAVRARDEAVAQVQRAEASKLLALAQVELETFPTGALAYATKSLEIADTMEARLFALRVLQEAPTATRTPDQDWEDGLDNLILDFSRDGEWLAAGGFMKAQLRNRDGRERTILHGEYPSTGFQPVSVGFGRESDILVTNKRGDVRKWSVPEGREVRRAQHEEGDSGPFMRGKGFFTSTTVGAKEFVRFWPLPEGESRLIGTMDSISVVAVSATGSQLAYGHGRKIYLRSLDNWDVPPQLLAENPADVSVVAFHPDGQSVAVIDESEELRIWPTSGQIGRPLRILEAKGCGGVRYTQAKGCGSVRYSPTGKWIVADCQVDGRLVTRLWDLTAPSVAEPLVLRGDLPYLFDFRFDPSERWLATAHSLHSAFWPLGEAYPRLLGGHKGNFGPLAFTPDGTTLISGGGDGVRAWPLNARGPTQPRILLPTGMNWGLAVDPTGKQIATGGDKGRVSVVPLAGGPARVLEGFSDRAYISAVAFDPDGRRVAAGPSSGPAQEKVIRIWDLKSGAVQVLGPVPFAGDGGAGGIYGLSFLGQDRILAGFVAKSPVGASDPGLLLFDLRTGKGTVLSTKPQGPFVISRTGGFGLGVDQRYPQLIAIFDLVRFSLDGKTQTTLVSHHGAIAVAMDERESLIASMSGDGTVRVGPISGAEPHLFLGHNGSQVGAVAFSPDGRWVASTDGETIRLWPVPDVTKTPLHKRSHEEFLATLRSWTNVQAVPDAKSATGWKLETGPFPGWKNVPTW